MEKSRIWGHRFWQVTSYSRPQFPRKNHEDVFPPFPDVLALDNDLVQWIAIEGAHHKHMVVVVVVVFFEPLVTAHQNLQEVGWGMPILKQSSDLVQYLQSGI